MQNWRKAFYMYIRCYYVYDITIWLSTTVTMFKISLYCYACYINCVYYYPLCVNQILMLICLMSASKMDMWRSFPLYVNVLKCLCSLSYRILGNYQYEGSWERYMQTQGWTPLQNLVRLKPNSTQTIVSTSFYATTKIKSCYLRLQLFGNSMQLP